MSGARSLFQSRADLPRAVTVPQLGRVLSADAPLVQSRTDTHTSDPARSPGRNGRKWSQEDQDRQDAEKKKKVMKELVSTWMDRLQLISVITTFFAAIESQLLSLVIPAGKSGVSRIEQAAAIGLSCALVAHVFAAIIAFVAAFFLVRFRVREATRAELKAELGRSPKGSSDEADIFSTNPHLEAVGPFRKGEPPLKLLGHCHSIAMALSLVGFALCVIGLMSMLWATLPASASIAATLVLALCLGASFTAMFASAIVPPREPWYP